ncbi:sugar transferase [Paenibacillus sp. JX-17]|uniref:Sugar transferase n=1 Tax=Paenibacillus lacisoli TaxID=3064525 RepID=A0ABT9CD93_9BACL|nr:sugar transferase [Paenibacillus sp. JX-17]MDO7907201.1 sugar transferase [Paenibacillus sp. JX-17]
MSASPETEVESLIASASEVYIDGSVLEASTRVSSYIYFKRILDVCCAAVGLVALSALLLVIAVLIKLEDWKGPVIFYQTRVGKDGKHFRMYKFRSMVTNAEAQLEQLLEHNEIQGAMFKMKEDPRVTRVGRFIRRTSLDELPQLFNVLKGDMSLVGPRPALPREVEEYSPYDKQRLLVTPGCTGLWQVSGRNHLTFHEMVRLDLDYICNRSILLDIKIILKTFRVLLGSKDAY